MEALAELGRKWHVDEHREVRPVVDHAVRIDEAGVHWLDAAGQETQSTSDTLQPGQHKARFVAGGAPERHQAARDGH